MTGQQDLDAVIAKLEEARRILNEMDAPGKETRAMETLINETFAATEAKRNAVTQHIEAQPDG